jgi:hypothetical protein
MERPIRVTNQEVAHIASSPPHAIICSSVAFSGQANHASSACDRGVAAGGRPISRCREQTEIASPGADSGQARAGVPLVVANVHDAAELAVVGGVLHSRDTADPRCAREGAAGSTSKTVGIDAAAVQQVRAGKLQAGLVGVGTRVVVVPLGRIGHHIHPSRVVGGTGNRRTTGIQQGLRMGQ